jgi:IS5 family transposase
LLLQQWYGLSDEGLEAAVDDRLSFRRFAGIPDRGFASAIEWSRDGEI